MILGETVYHYNGLMITHIGMKLSTHTYYITTMTLNWFPWQQPTTNSLRQFSLVDGCHGNNEIRLRTFPYNYFFTSQTCKPCNAWS